MNILDLLKGKTIRVKSDVGVDVDLEIREVEEHRSVIDLEPSTQANDWWPNSKTVTTYTVHFTNGHSKKYLNIRDLIIR